MHIYRGFSGVQEFYEIQENRFQPFPENLSRKDDLIRIWLKDMLLDDNIDIWETREPGGLPSFFGGANPSDERKEGVADVCYILWFNSDWNIHLHPCRIMLHDFQGKTKIAAITRDNDGRPFIKGWCYNIRGKPLLWLSLFLCSI